MAKQRRARGEGSLRKRSDGRWEGRYHQDVLNALPDMPVTNCLSAVRDFIKGVKGDTYFEMCS